MALNQADWNEIDTVLLDMDGTLLDLHFDNYFWLTYLPQIYSDKNGLTLQESTRRLFAQMENMRGRMEWYCFDYWSDTLNLDISALELEVAHKIAVRPFAREFVKACKQQHKQVVLLTNAHRDSLSLKMQRTAIDEHFDQLISAHDYGVPKENQALWCALHDDCDYTPARTLLIDDTENVLRSARTYGIHYLITVVQPDSQIPPRDALEFPAIEHFDEVMPV